MSKLHEKPFKYRYFLDNFENCPPEEYVEMDCEAWRWVFEDLTLEKNFQPVLVINPSRINDAMFDAAAAKCLGYGLSFFDTAENAKNRFRKISVLLKKRDKNFEQAVGSKLASVKINTWNGVGSKPTKKQENKGHFNFHEYQFNNFFGQIIEVQNLLP